MQPSLDVQIRGWLAGYLAGNVSLSNFDRWLASNTWSVHRSGNPLAADLTYEIEHRFAEYANGDWTDQDLHDLLLPLLDPAWGTQSQSA